VLVRYNPEGDAALNQRQSGRLKQLSDYLHGKSQSRFMFELLVPAEKAQLDRLKGNTKAYDLELRPKLVAQTIKQLQDAASNRMSGRLRGSIGARTAKRSCRLRRIKEG